MSHSSTNKKWKCLIAAVASLISFSAAAVDLDWSGLYRIEGNMIKNSELNGGYEKAYALHHLILKPKIVAADGLYIHARFDIFNIANANDPIYNNSQMGQVFGHGVSSLPAGSTAQSTTANSSTFANRQAAETLEVTQLYLTWDQEFGSLIVGRVPVQFGLGMTYSAGNGLFDHWYDTRDLIGYKIVMGNLFLLPMYAKVNENTIANGVDDISEYLIQAQYDNPETDISMGVMYQVRTSSAAGGDAPVSATQPLIGGTGATNGEAVSMSWVNLFALKDTERFRLGLEASFQSGKTGVRTASLDKVSLDGFGIAGEFEYRPDQSRWKYGVKAGIATGDDPATDNKYEGYLFNRNYDVAFLLFNHPLGQDDFSRSYLVGGNPINKRVQTADTNTITNITYASVYADYKWTDRLTLIGGLTTGWFGEKAAKTIGKLSKDVGYETDFTLRFSPKAGVVWDNQIGMLFPGAAFKGGGAYSAGFAYGFGTRAAISF